MKDKIREILKKHNEWDVFDDEVEDGYASVEYHKETLDKVVSEIATLCEEQCRRAYNNGLQDGWESANNDIRGTFRAGYFSNGIKPTIVELEKFEKAYREYLERSS